MKLLISILVLATVIMLSGCSTLPTPKEMQTDVEQYKLPRTPSSDKAIVYMVRPDSVGAFVRFNVFVDNKEDSSEVGYTRGGQYIYFNVSPGKHKILSKAENWDETEIESKVGDIVFIKQNAEMGFLMARNSLTKIEKVEGTYHVKHLTLGTIKNENLEFVKKEVSLNN